MTLKQPYGAQNHDAKMVGANRINDWFADPPGFMAALVQAGYILPGDPANSPFFRLTGFDGPMFKVFTDEELATFTEWTLWLAQGHQPKPVDYGVQMALAIQTLRERQTGAMGHATHTLVGPDVADFSRPCTRTVAEWFAQADTPAGVLAFMHALANADNPWIRAGEPDQSPFVTQLLAPSAPMGDAFNSTDSAANDLTWRQIAIEWIRQGCPVPALHTEGKRRRYRLWSPPPTDSLFPVPKVRGMGTVH